MSDPNPREIVLQLARAIADRGGRAWCVGGSVRDVLLGQERKDWDLEVFGLLRTMVDPRVNLSNEVSAQLVEHFDDKVFRTVVPRNVRLAEAPSFGRPVLYHDKRSRGALAYLALAGEVLRREDERAAMTH